MDKKVNSFLEKARVSAELFANRTGRAATQAASTAGKTASNVMEATRLNLQIFDLNTEIEILYKEIGKMVGLSKERVRQVKEKALAKLRTTKINQVPDAA